MRSIKIYLRFSAQNIRGILEYKNDFIVSTIAGTVMQTFGLIFLFVLFDNIQAIGGWTLYEVALLYGCMMIGEGSLTFLFQGTTSLTYRVRIGEFDRFMLRPLSITTQLMGTQINFAGLGTMITGISVITYSLLQLGKAPGIGLLLLFTVNILFGVGIRVNINLATTSMAFWMIDGGGFSNLVYQSQEYGKYPITIYPTAIRIILLTLLPHAMVSFVPVCLLLGRLAVWPFILAVPASFVFMTLLRRFIFNRALKRYESAGN